MTGGRVYSSIERKSKRRQLRRSGKSQVSRKRARSARDQARALRAKGLLPQPGCRGTTGNRR